MSKPVISKEDYERNLEFIETMGKDTPYGKQLRKVLDGVEVEGQKYPDEHILKERITNVISDTLVDLLYYNRKEDDDLPIGAIEDAIEHGIITVDEILELVRKQITHSVEE